MLDEASRDYTAFMTPWGRYRFKRAPQGCKLSGDKYVHETDVVFGDIQDTAKVVDDIAPCTVTFHEQVERVVEILMRSREHGITMSPGKFIFAEPEIKFVGYIIGRDGIKVDPAKVKSITEFPRPQSITDLRSFDGMVNQVARFSPVSYTHLTLPTKA